MKSNNTYSDTESRKSANKDSIKRKPTQRRKKPRIADGGEIRFVIFENSLIYFLAILNLKRLLDVFAEA